METNGCGSTVLQFPQPSRPFFAYPENNTFDSSAAEELGFQFLDRSHEPGEPSRTRRASQSADDDNDDDVFVQILRECAAEFGGKGREMVKEILSRCKIDKEFSAEWLEKEYEALTEDIRGGQVSDFFDRLLARLSREETYNGRTTSERCVSRDSTSRRNNIKRTLERFKVKTINLPEVVKDEGTDATRPSDQ